MTVCMGVALLGTVLWRADAHAGDFPESQYPAKVFGGLSGSMVLYDASGGALSEARAATIGKDFTDLTKVQLVQDFSADMTKFFATAQNGGAMPWSVIEFVTPADFFRARDGGMLEKLDTSVVPLDQMEAGTYDDYGVNVEAYGITLAYNTTKFPDAATAPKTMEDIFDVAKFPGKRCFFKYPEFGATLESALLADGVARDKLYPLDVDRALKKLDTIKDSIVWWSSGDEAIRLLLSGECNLGIAWSGRVYSAVKTDKAPLALTWNNALYSVSVYAIPKGAPNIPAGQAFISMWIRDLAGQKAYVSKITYTTAIKQLNKEGYSPDLDPWIVAGANAKAAIPEDDGYYAKNLPAIVDKFNRWIAK